MRPSISQAVKVVVESGTAADVGLMVRNLFQIIQSQLISPKLGIIAIGTTRTPFAVRDIGVFLYAYSKR